MRWETRIQPGLCAPSAVALGYFDGVHLGHRRVLDAARQCAAQHGLVTAAFTFRLPAGGGAGKGRLLLTETEKRRRMAKEGVQEYFCPPFADFCGLSPARFVDDVLLGCLHARCVFCGDNFTFGAHKGGNVEILGELCAQRGIGVTIVDMAQYENDLVSSTRVRQALADGNVEAANAMLGEPYRLDLSACRAQLGQGMDQPAPAPDAPALPVLRQTFAPGMLVPRPGVYLAAARLGGVWRPACCAVAPVQDGTCVCDTLAPHADGPAHTGADAPFAVCLYHYEKPLVRFAGAGALQRYLLDAAEAAAALLAQGRTTGN